MTYRPIPKAEHPALTVGEGTGSPRLSEALTVVPGSYRPVPADRDKVGAVEMAMCGLCSHSRGLEYCSPPRRNPTGAWSSRSSLNAMGDCDFYQPTRWTRILRKFGLRKPVMR